MIRDFLPDDTFQRLRAALLNSEWNCRVHQQGDTITRRVPICRRLLDAVPELQLLLEDHRWRGLLAYIASTRSQPLYYLQTIVGGIAAEAPDPQVELHSDTFHPSLKAWLFLTDVADDGRPLTYVAGSHLATPQRLAWEKEKSSTVLESGDRLSQRGSLRVTADELTSIGLSQPVRFAVPANTFVAVDTYGFHARAASERPSVRVEIWAYSRRTPFLPCTLVDLLSLRPFADKRASWLWRIVDRLDRLGIAKQHWRTIPPRRPGDQ